MPMRSLYHRSKVATPVQEGEEAAPVAKKRKATAPKATEAVVVKKSKAKKEKA